MRPMSPPFYSATVRPLSLPARWLRVGRLLMPFGRRHARALIVGGALALIVVSVRLTIPWLFRAFLKPFLSGTHHGFPVWAKPWMERLSPVLTIGSSFAVLMLILGYADYRSRLSLVGFAIAPIRDLRDSVSQAGMQHSPQGRLTRPGGFVARVIGAT